jgi:hypothetical protein
VSDPMKLHLVTAESDKHPVINLDKLDGFRDRTHSPDSAWYTRGDAEQWQANKVNATHIP